MAADNAVLIQKLVALLGNCAQVMNLKESSDLPIYRIDVDQYVYTLYREVIRNGTHLNALVFLLLKPRYNHLHRWHSLGPSC
jgi:hypothetical protein